MKEKPLVFGYGSVIGRGSFRRRIARTPSSRSGSTVAARLPRGIIWKTNRGVGNRSLRACPFGRLIVELRPDGLSSRSALSRKPLDLEAAPPRTKLAPDVRTLAPPPLMITPLYALLLGPACCMIRRRPLAPARAGHSGCRGAAACRTAFAERSMLGILVGLGAVTHTVGPDARNLHAVTSARRDGSSSQHCITLIS